MQPHCILHGMRHVPGSCLTQRLRFPCMPAGIRMRALQELFAIAAEESGGSEALQWTLEVGGSQRLPPKHTCPAWPSSVTRVLPMPALDLP